MMNEVEIDNTEGQAPAAPEQELWPSPGKILKTARERRGITQAHVAEALHLTIHYVNALENDEYHKLPGKTFVKGYLVSYTKLLKEDVDAVVGCYTRFSDALDESKDLEAEIIQRRKATDQNLRWLVCAAVIIVAGLALAWWFGRDSQTDEITGNAAASSATEVAIGRVEVRPETAEVLVSRNSVLPSPGIPAEEPGELVRSGEDESVAVRQGREVSDTPSSPARVENSLLEPGDFDAAGTANSSPLPGLVGNEHDEGRIISLNGEGDDLLVMRFSGTSWVEVDNREDIRLYNDTLAPGDELTIRGDAPFDVLLGNALMVDVVFNRESVNVRPAIRSDNSARILLEP